MENKYFKNLTNEEREIIANKGTEAPFSGEYNDHFEQGYFVCRACHNKLYESKKKLVGNAYSKSDWTSSFTSSYSNNNKLYDHEGSYLNEETNSNTLSISKNIFDSGVTKSSVSIAKNNVKIGTDF